MPRRRVIIMGAAGRDFHNFNTVYRRNRAARVVAFTATQIPNIAMRQYPARLAGPLYPKGIPSAGDCCGGRAHRGGQEPDGPENLPHTPGHG